MSILGYIICGWLASVLVAVCCLAKEEWHEKAKWFLCWSLFPFPLIFKPKRFGYVKSWLLFFISPFMFSVYFVALVIWGFYYPPQDVSMPYRTAGDLKMITGVEFPDVALVDSDYYSDWNREEIIMKFTPSEPLTKEFIRSLDKACKEDSCCWSKDNEGYHYFIFPERPIDRPAGTHIRQVDCDGVMTDDWDGDYIEVQVPLKGDTIYVSDGWCL